MPGSDDPPRFQQIIQQLESLNLQERALISERELLTEELRAAVHTAQPTAPPRYKPGDKVLIINKLAKSKILGSTPTIADYAAIVKKYNTLTGRVTFTTFNGLSSNRKPAHLRKLNPGEERSARAAARGGTA